MFQKMKMIPNMTLLKLMFGTIAESAVQRLIRSVVRLSESQLAKNIYIYLNYVIIIFKMVGFAYFAWKYVKIVFPSTPAVKKPKEKRTPRKMALRRKYSSKRYVKRVKLPVIQEEETGIQEDVGEGGEDFLLVMLTKDE